MSLQLAELDSIIERRGTANERAANASRYGRDPLLWIDDNVYAASKFTEEGGRQRIQAVKMRLYPDQRELIGAWIDLERLGATGELEFGNVLVEKSRQIGATWAVAAAVRWLLGFTSTRGLFMHTRAGEVADRGWTIDSFFGRIRYIDDHLDAVALPEPEPMIYRPFSKDPASIESPTGASVRGECQRDDPGRGSTFDWATVDEAAHVQHGEQVHTAIDDAAEQGKCYMSTPEGEDNMHARMCDERPAGWTYLRLHWSGHPVYQQGLHTAGTDKTCAACRANREGIPWSPREPHAHRYPGKLTSPWYDRAVIGKTNEQVAGELDIDRAGALGARVYAEFDEGMHVAQGGIPYEPNLPLELGWDFGLDATAVVVIQPAPDEVRVIGLLECGDLFASKATPDAVADELRHYLRELGVGEGILASTESIRGIGDRAGAVRNTQTGASDFAVYRRRGFTIAAPRESLVRRSDTGITAVKLLLAGSPKDLRVCGVNARTFATRLRNHVWPMDPQGNRRLGSTSPLDNLHKHACDAFRYWVVETHPPQGGGEMTIARPTGQVAAPRFLRPQGPRDTRLQPRIR